jgi:hypothetical protein
MVLIKFGPFHTGYYFEVGNIFRHINSYLLSIHLVEDGSGLCKGCIPTLVYGRSQSHQPGYLVTRSVFEMVTSEYRSYTITVASLPMVVIVPLHSMYKTTVIEQISLNSKISVSMPPTCRTTCPNNPIFSPVCFRG